MNARQFRCELLLPFADCEEASVAYNTLRVDTEPQRSITQRILKVDNEKLLVSFVSSEARNLRTSVNSFFELYLLVVETIQKFKL
ncbi:EKC/KEOPS complex subunit LAGE3-like protein [Leptotrombidium deliense]|uniref:L antigen family member 3 n=1 Tax=Leptotrombidium deliense TaxID=299467 RepID=A0A443ST08_9ACAR|nr:EKC/KEOPS complex subunit LAGE3-like protein [Leptotrombidium deliense]